MTSVVSQDPAQTGSNRVLPAPDLWEMVVLGRQGQPPLRFKGQRLAHLRRTITGTAVLFVDVWARKKGDCVLAYSRYCNDTLKPDARVIAGVSDVADCLEMLCKGSPSQRQQADLSLTLSHLMRALEYHQQFAILVGDFLAEFEAFSARHTTLQTASEG